MEAPPEGIYLVRGGTDGFVDRLKRAEGGKIAFLGGGELAAALTEAGVIDEIHLDLHPIPLAAGAPLFMRTSKRVGMCLADVSRIASGCVSLNYRL